MKKTCTFIFIISKWIEQSYSNVDQHSQVKGDASPKRDVFRYPEERDIIYTHRINRTE